MAIVHRCESRNTTHVTIAERKYLPCRCRNRDHERIIFYSVRPRIVAEENRIETAGFYVNIFLQKDEYLQCQQPEIASYDLWAIVVKLLNIRVSE
ncbi:hypothetical protein CY34DRAFT_351550 [Suillus luteus UH-Slu-Lm8-n1]|uniref:Uncharacterized protein n=1 Tax=Suillus luteus UH-Slu-Lm8-n1 TaxID=930992 RepID=A0A0C9ZNA5_9AGAM|nr:hypothetical protein CY34DRAFT_351550 [Suillus luteus UH-Slu-Lm8-n1]